MAEGIVRPTESQRGRRVEGQRLVLRPDQVAAIEDSCEIVAVEIPTIELAGGSVRCMIAGVHLDRRPLADAEPTAAAEAIDENPGTIDGQDIVEVE